MARWQVHQVDGNADEIYKAAKRLGFSVEKTGRPVDAILGIYDQTIAVEVKREKGQLEPSQRTFFRTFKGLKALLRSTGDVFDLYQEMRRRHDLIFSAAATHNGGSRDGKEDEGTKKGQEGQAGPKARRQDQEERRRRRKATVAAAEAASADRGRADQTARRLRRIDR